MTTQVRCDMCGRLRTFAGMPDNPDTPNSATVAEAATWERIGRYDICPNCTGDIRHFNARGTVPTPPDNAGPGGKP